MNRKQRESNRKNALKLNEMVRQANLLKHTCENCGLPGGHWVSLRGPSLEAILTGVDDQQGFWTCTQTAEILV